MMADVDWQARIDNVRWYHEFDFGGGLKTRNHDPSIQNSRRLWKFMAQHLDKIDFHGKRVLDIGCWDGYWSFDAERRGAKYVLATDDATQNWGDGSGLLIAKQLLRSSVNVHQEMSVYNLSSLNEKFDVIFCFGVFYHLLDPFRAFAEIRHCCHAKSIVLFEGDMAWSGLKPGDVRYRCSPISDQWPWTFLPSTSAFDALVGAAYLRTESRDFLSPNALAKLNWLRRLAACVPPWMGRLPCNSTISLMPRRAA
jgi:tRNA (mo5U34)-methyltransferase